ncbi:putative ribonuclease P protein subunit p29 [Apostichopus japonicus]|uniref:Ribonuclease P protein subunit p29 n=1 Tax=Stichopus japonicus TaxID=307972 RepID=A0A2G8KGC1_STIJA|nr:putative ribonuclease P protein subunit p29 [Apostichopus japonicus]
MFQGYDKVQTPHPETSITSPTNIMRIPHHEARFGQYLNIEKTGRKKLRTPRKAANLRKKQVLSAADKKQLKLFDIPEDQQKYKLYEPLHHLWLAYMRDCLRIPPISAQAQGIKLLKCDLHGSFMKVTKSTCPTYIGMCGILLQETKNTFKIITQADQLKTVPKANCEFTFVVDELVVTIHGKHFRLKSSERALKGKIKDKITIDM